MVRSSINTADTSSFSSSSSSVEAIPVRESIRRRGRRRRLHRVVVPVATTMLCWIAASSLGRARAFSVATPAFATSRVFSFSTERWVSKDSDSDDASGSAAAVAPVDRRYMDDAARLARAGFGGTFPNPAVGCVLVRTEDDVVLGRGFHPRAGSPHAEVFALLEAAGHVDCGVAAAESVRPRDGRGGPDDDDDDDEELAAEVRRLSAAYGEPGGPAALFENRLAEHHVTAYVTLEPCCHTGRTPPCSESLRLAGVDRVVVGRRDPNPRVDGGGVRALREAGATVDLYEEDDATSDALTRLVADFFRRVSTDREETPELDGRRRRFLRRTANSWKAAGTMPSHALDHASEIDDPRWLETLDALLWRRELVVVRAGRACAKRRECADVGERIAAVLGARVAQVLGKTVLLYRPGAPPVLRLDDHDDDDDAKQQE